MLATLPTSDDEARVLRAKRDLSRFRVVFAVLAIGIPAGLGWLFERQARRLDALADHGVVGEAKVTEVTQGSVFYTYEVGGAHYEWNVASKDAPHTAGESFRMRYLPENPSFNLPNDDSAFATSKAASNRSFARNTVAGIFTFLFTCAIACDVQLRRVRARGIEVLTGPRAIRNRLIFAGLMLTPLLALVIGFHASDAIEKHESVWPVVLAALLSMVLFVGTCFHLLRGGVANIGARTASMMRWVAPLAVGVALLRSFGWMLGWH